MTNVEEIRSLVDAYRLWLRDKTKLKSVHADWVEITTPFLDKHNDFIQIYARRENGGYRITDDGNTIRDLEISGSPINSPKRRDLLRVALNGLAVQEDNGELVVRASSENFPARKHALVQAILAVNDLFYTASPTVFSLFKEDVARWLDLSEIRYLPNVQFTGKSGYIHYFDFAIPRSHAGPERILKAINNPNKDTAQSLIFSWLDTKEERPEDSSAWAFINDQEKPVSPSVVEALEEYDIQPVLWSRRDDKKSQLLL